MFLQQADSSISSISGSGEIQSQIYRFRSVPRPGHLSFRVALNCIPCANHVFDFDNLELVFTQDENVWRCESCGIASFGADPTEASSSFCEDFGVLWEEIALQPDDTLSESAQIMKKCMLAAVKSVR